MELPTSRIILKISQPAYYLESFLAHVTYEKKMSLIQFITLTSFLITQYDFKIHVKIVLWSHEDAKSFNSIMPIQSS